MHYVDRAPRTYRAFGLNIASALPLPELLPVNAHAAALEVLVGQVPEQLLQSVHRGVRYEAAPGRLLLRVDGVARFLVEAGQRITVQAEKGADEISVRLFLLGTALGAALHQRGDLVLHGSAVAAGNAAVAFLGRSGIGKSTLAMELRRRGYPVLTDDLCVVRPGPGDMLYAHPAYPQSKLWPDSLQRLEAFSDDLKRVRPSLEKRVLPLETAFSTEAMPLKRIYLLRTGSEEDVEFSPLNGVAKFEGLRSETYRMRFVGGMGTRDLHLGHSAALARQASLTLVRRPKHGFRLSELADRIENDW